MTKDERWLLEEKYGGEESPGYEADRKRLACGEPLAHVIGWQPFLGLKIYLDSRPLIPRVETEWWAGQMLQSEAVQQKMGVGLGLAARSAHIFCCAGSRLTFLDLCAGSGAIGCAALARAEGARVSFGELDPAHEPTILKNIRENHLDATRADIRIGDLFEPFAGMTFDIIAANPPYIPAGRTLPASVTDYEPALALFAGNDGLAIIRRIAAELSAHLAPGGKAFIEIDTAHAALACALFSARGFRAETLNDQFDRPRVLVVSYPS